MGEVQYGEGAKFDHLPPQHLWVAHERKRGGKGEKNQGKTKSAFGGI